MWKKKSELRSRSVLTLKNFKNSPRSLSDVDTMLLNSLKLTKQFIYNNSNIIFTRADKRNTVVALENDDYVKNIEVLLSDKNTYFMIDYNPINKLFNNFKELLKSWRSRGYISDIIYSHLNTSVVILPRAYGLPKTHKNKSLFRLIVSSINSPLHNFALFIHKIIHESLAPLSSHIDNSFH